MIIQIHCFLLRGPSLVVNAIICEGKGYYRGFRPKVNKGAKAIIIGLHFDPVGTKHIPYTQGE